MSRRRTGGTGKAKEEGRRKKSQPVNDKRKDQSAKDKKI